MQGRSGGPEALGAAPRAQRALSGVDGPRASPLPRGHLHAALSRGEGLGPSLPHARREPSSRSRATGAAVRESAARGANRAVSTRPAG